MASWKFRLVCPVFLTDRTLFTNIFVFVTTQSCARGLCDTHLPDLNHSASQSKRSSCSRVSRDRRNRGVSGASSPSRVIYHTFAPHFASFAPAFLSCLPCFPASFPSVLFTTHLIRILLALCLLCFLACFGFFCLVTVLLTLS